MLKLQRRYQTVDYNCEAEIHKYDDQSLAHNGNFKVNTGLQWIDMTLIDAFLLFFEYFYSLKNISHDNYH